MKSINKNAMNFNTPLTKVFLALFGLLIILTGSSFTNGSKPEPPNSDIKEKIHRFFMSKRYKKALVTIHNLDSINGVLRNDTTEYGIKYRKLDASYSDLNNKYSELNTKQIQMIADHNHQKKVINDLNAKYDELQNATLTNTEKMNIALKSKEEELKERERKLKEMQSVINRQDSITNALNSIVKNALLGFKTDELSVEMKNGKVYVSMRDKLLFKSGSADVEEKGKDALKKLVDVLNKNQDVDILVEGHTDNVPIKTDTYKDNWDLSVSRATSIVRVLTVDDKMNPKRVTASGRGEYFPVASNQTPEGKARNRRTEIILSPKLDELMKMLGSK